MTLALLAFGALVALLVLARYRHDYTVRDWTFALSPEAAEAVAQVEHSAAMDQDMMADAWSRAEAARMQGAAAEAVRLLELALWVVEDATPGRLERLVKIAELARKAAAVMPTRAVRVRDFRLRRLRTLAGCSSVLHLLLVAPRERVVMEARMLGFFFRTARLVMRRSRDRASAQPEVLRYWRAFGFGVADWTAADKAGLEMNRAAHMTLANEMRGVR